MTGGSEADRSRNRLGADLSLLRARGWEIEADLAVDIETSTGFSTSGRLTSRGQVLQLEVDRPDVLFAATGRRSGLALAEQLAARGVAAELHGPRGRIADLDPGRHSQVAAAVLGNRHLSIGPAGWRALACATVPGSLQDRAERAAPALTTMAAAITVAVVCWRLCRPHGGPAAGPIPALVPPGRAMPVRSPRRSPIRAGG